MHDHDLDLIAAYGDGLLSADEAEEARRRLAECQVCRDELRRQRQVREALRAFPAPAMTAEERSRLASAVLDQIGREAPVVDLAARRNRRWVAALGSVAAVLVVVVGIGGMLRDTDGGVAGTGEAADRIAMAGGDAAEATTTAAETEAFVPTTTVSLFTDGGEPDQGPPVIVDAGQVDEAGLAQVLDDVRSRLGPDVPPLATEDFAAGERAVPACFGIASGAEGAVAVVTAVVEDVPVEVYLVPSEEGFAARGFRVEGCEAFPVPG